MGIKCVPFVVMNGMNWCPINYIVTIWFVEIVCLNYLRIKVFLDAQFVDKKIQNNYLKVFYN